MSLSGKIETSILKNVLNKLKKDKVVVIKSTITPAAAQEIIKEYPDQYFVFNPEFLTERTAVEDFKNPSRIVLGGETEAVAVVKSMYLSIFPEVEYIVTHAKTACFIKYMSNCFSAIKICPYICTLQGRVFTDKLL